DIVDVVNATYVSKVWRSVKINSYNWSDYLVRHPLFYKDNLTVNHPYKACAREAKIKSNIFPNIPYAKKLSPFEKPLSTENKSEIQCNFLGTCNNDFVTQFFEKRRGDNGFCFLNSRYSYTSHLYTNYIDNSLSFKKLKYPRDIKIQKAVTYNNESFVSISSKIFKVHNHKLSLVSDFTTPIDDFIVFDTGLVVRLNNAVRVCFKDKYRTERTLVKDRFTESCLALYGEYVVVGMRFKLLEFYDHDLNLKHQINFNKHDVTSLSTWQNKLVVTSSNGSIRFYDSEVLLTKVFIGHTKEITNLATMGDHLVSASQDCALRIWEPNGKNYKIVTSNCPIKKMAVKGTQILIHQGDDNEVTLYDLAGKPPMLPRIGPVTRYLKYSLLIATIVVLAGVIFKISESDN
ncbi:MAG: hypothetical protein JHC93_08720, partial [Parachlamydiales bacterium]|nr:hypothetical protein [Parachlamydiales bacterium]